MDQSVIPPPGTPAAELSRLNDEEHQIAEREVALLTQGAGVEARAREVQSALDEVRAALQRLAGSTMRAEAEKAFMQSLSQVVPPHVASAETSRALDLRRKALVARQQALDAEGGVVRARAATLAKIGENIVKLRNYTAALAARAGVAQPAAAAPAARPAAARAAPQPAPAAARPAPVAASPQAPARAAVAAQPQARPVVAAAPAAARPALQRPQPAVPAAGRPSSGLEALFPSEAQVPRAAPAAAPVQNTRATPRQKVNAEVTLASETNLYTGFSGDLSEGGVFVATYEKMLPQGTQVEVTLALPNRPPIKVNGKVAWARDPSDHAPGIFPGMGIAFENISPEAAAVLKDFLQKREPMFWDA